VRIVLGVSDLPDGTKVDPASVRVSIDGEPVKATAEDPGSSMSTAPVERTALLLIDTSGSMSGAGIAGAKTAAAAFLSAVPTDVRVGLVAFSDKARLAVAPTTDRNVVRRAVAGLVAHGETSLYDGLQLAVATVGTTGARTILLLSDGADTTSKASLPRTLAALHRSHPVLDAVAFNTSDAQSGVLARLATASGGHVIKAQAASQLATAFKQVAHDVSNDLVITAQVPDHFADQQATVEVTARAGGQQLSDFASVHLGLAPTRPDGGSAYGAVPVTAKRGFVHSRDGFYAALAALFLGLMGILVMAFSEVNRDRAITRFRRRLSVYTLTGKRPQKTQETTVLGESAVAQSAVEWAGRLVARHDLEAKLQLRLEGAGLPMKPAEWVLVHAGVTIASGLLLLLLTGVSFVGGVLGLALGGIGAWMFLGVKKQRRTAAFLARIPDTLQLMSGSLSAGYSLPQAVDAVVREGAEPVAGEFKRALVEARLGVPLEDALDGVAERMHSKDFGWVVMAVRIQREVGGNLAELLSTVAATLRERERLRRQVQVLSAEGRLSAYILFGLPVVFATYLYFVRPEYLRPLYTDPLGWALLVILVVTLAVGGIWLRKVVRVEV
jgi:tight adherence protein B